MQAEPLSELDAIRLERGDLVILDQCPFQLPCAEDLDFLRSREISEKTYHNIQFDPATHRFAGAGTISADELQRLETILGDFSCSVTSWLTETFPFYAPDLIVDQASLRVHEEATRSLRHSGRNDLLHVDSFPNRPTGGRRVLRIFTNFNETEERVWAMGEKFPLLLRHYPAGQRMAARTRNEWKEPAQSWQRLVQRDWSGRPAYDTFMYRLEEFLKTDEKIQERILKRYCRFAPGSTWLVFADGVSHAVLRGRYALEHSYYISECSLLEPEAAPLSHLVEMSQQHQALRAG